MKAIHVFKAIGSGIIWGLGQLFNKQYIKALIFFLIMGLVVCLEIGTGDYFNTSELSIYDKISGDYFHDQGSRTAIAGTSGFPGSYKSAVSKRTAEMDEEWLTDYEKIGERKYTVDDLILQLGKRVRRVYDSLILEPGDEGYDSTKADKVQLSIEVEANESANLFAIEVAKNKAEELCAGLTGAEYDAKYESEYNAAYITAYNSRYNSLYKSAYNAALLKEPLLDYAKTYFESLGTNPSYQNVITGEDWNEAMLRIYFAAFPEEFEAVNSRTMIYAFERGGFFFKSLWGITSLGNVPMTELGGGNTISVLYPQVGQFGYATSIILSGHDSTRVLIQAIVGLITLTFIVFIYIWNIKDAYKTSVQRSKGIRLSQKEYFKDLYERSFEYIVLTPTIIVIAYVTLMPIIFSLLVAFTNYDTDHIPPGSLFEWVGIKNFFSLFGAAGGSSIPFGNVFWKVLAWTLIWAVGATFTCFFGGFLQAVILNNKRVVFRKFWRTILILPWAVPALVSQMIFKLFFADTGVANEFLRATGANTFLKNIGLLGRPLQEVQAGTFFEQFFYLGDSVVQWFSNPINPWLPRIFLIILNIWLGFPYFMAMMSGIMTSISKDLYEAAEIDGATPVQQFQKITMPLVLYSTAPLLIMSFSSNFNNFGVIYFITGGGPNKGTVARAYAGDTDILISWIYTLTTDDNVRWYSMASVFSILIFLVIGTISTWNYLRTKSFKEEDMI